MPHDPLLPVDLGDGLVLRQSRAEDVDRLAAFNAEVHRGDAPEPAAWIDGWTRDLMRGNHPTFGPDDFTIVEERATGAIVSATNLISQTWTYGGIPFGVGRVELVGTRADYRRRGLIRHQLDVLHRWSAARGELAQSITGIPWYYRQFGYEFALDLSGARFVEAVRVPKLKDAETEPFRLRRATPDDAAFCIEADRAGRRRYLVTCARSETEWRYEIAGRDFTKPGPPVVLIVETPEGRAAGYVVLAGRLSDGTLSVWSCELADGVSWLTATPSILRGLIPIGQEWAKRPGAEPFATIGLDLETDHPLYRWGSDRRPRENKPYTWYVRVPDVPAFLRHIRPVLEARLAASEAVGYGGAPRLSFYRDGVRLRFEAGRLVEIEPWTPTDAVRPSARFPELSFLRLLLGHRSIHELVDQLADCTTLDAPTTSLLDVLFPKMPSTIYPVA